MTLIHEVLERNPLDWSIPNDGVAKVGPPETPEEWSVLRYELQSFVAEGEYEAGLDRILYSYLKHLGGDSQPAAWASGFFGSGKSHMLKALAALWSDLKFPDDARASGLVKLPPDLAAKFKELTTRAPQFGGRFAAAGTLNAGGSSAALSILGIVFAAAGLPKAYSAARLVLWLKKNDIYEPVITHLESHGATLESELMDMYVSDKLAAAVLSAKPDYATSTDAVLDRFAIGFPIVEDLTREEFVQVLETTVKGVNAGTVPLTLLVLDELQLFLGDDPDKTWEMQQLVEDMCSKLGSRLLVVGAGQMALRATPSLQRLQDRFTVEVALRDTDVNRVVRSVVLRKQPAREAEILQVLDRAKGEIGRQFGGSNIGAVGEDQATLVADYPLLPARRRLWDAIARALDTGGRATKLRTQLRDVLDATKGVAERELGCVVPIDAIFDQKRDELLGTPLLTRDRDELIVSLDDGTDEGRLRARIAKVAYLLERLPKDGARPTGVQATEDVIVDCLVTDLRTDRAALDARVRSAIAAMVKKAVLSSVGGEYRLRNKVDAQWQEAFERYRGEVDDPAWIAGRREEALRAAFEALVRPIRVTQGEAKVARKFRVAFGDTEPKVQDDEVPVWVQTGWETTETLVSGAARSASTAGTIVYVFVPKALNAELSETLVTAEAADRTVNREPAPTTDDGLAARAAIATRGSLAGSATNTQVNEVLRQARVFLAGGAEVSEPAANPTVVDSVRKAIESSVLRMYPDFTIGDSTGWPRVVSLAAGGNASPLSAVGHGGDATAHPVCRAILSFLGPSGKRGQEVRRVFGARPYGWAGDTIDGALYALIAAGDVEAKHNGNVIIAKGFAQGSLGSVDFKPQTTILTIDQKLAMRKLAQDLGHSTQGKDDMELPKLVLVSLLNLAAAAGGEAPLPTVPDVERIRDLEMEAGNAQFVSVVNAKDELSALAEAWKRAAAIAPARRQEWDLANRLLEQAIGLDVHAEMGGALEAINAGRLLLAEPDPMAPIIDALADALRTALQEHGARFEAARTTAIRNLETQPTWQALDAARRDEILRAERLGDGAIVKLGTPHEIAATLAATPLHDWPLRVQAIPTQAASALMAAASAGMKEVPPVRLPHEAAVIRTEAELDTYLQKVRDAVSPHLADGKTVIV